MDLIPKFSTTNFSYNGQTKTFTAEASECGFPGGLRSIELINPNTGNSMVFEHSKTDSDTEGEIYGWWFTSTAGYKVLIIND